MIQRGLVRGRSKIGALRTIYASLGHAWASELHRAERFTVAQAFDVLGDSRFNGHPDVDGMRQTVHGYLHHFRGAASKPTVVIVDAADDWLVADGNKTAIAAYLYSLEAGEPYFELPVTYIGTGETGLFRVPVLASHDRSPS